MAVNGWRVMWVLAVFDVPVLTKEERRAYTVFRKMLLKDNFIQHQFSVYLKHFPTMAAAQAEIDRLKPAVPDDGHVAFFMLTDPPRQNSCRPDRTKPGGGDEGQKWLDTDNR